MVILSVHNSADIYGASRCLLNLFSLIVQPTQPNSQPAHEVHVVLPSDGPLVPLLQSHGIHVHIHPRLVIIDRAQLSSLRGRLTFLLNFPLSVLYLLALSLRLRADLLHTNTAVLPSPALAAFLARKPHLWHLREFFSEFPSIWRVFQHYMARLSTRVLCISHAVEQQFTPTLRPRCTILYDGLDDIPSDPTPATTLRASLNNPPVLIGCVGRIKFLRKGQEVLVRAAALLRPTHPDLHYAILGSVSPGNEDHLTNLHALIHSLHLDDRFHFLGEIPDTRPLYPAFDLTVVPSVLPEPFGLVVMESMAAGTPVIGSHCGGIPEQIVDGRTGLLFAPGNHEALAAAIHHLLADPALRHSMARESRLRFLHHFHIQQTCTQTLNLFHEVLAKEVPGKPHPTPHETPHLLGEESLK